MRGTDIAHLEFAAIRPPAKEFVSDAFDYINGVGRLTRADRKKPGEQVFKSSLLHLLVHPPQVLDPGFEAAFGDLPVGGLEGALFTLALDLLNAQVNAALGIAIETGKARDFEEFGSGGV